MTEATSCARATACAICGEHHEADRIWVVENTDGKFVASFSTHLLAHYFVEEGSGCYRYRAPPAQAEASTLPGEVGLLRAAEKARSVLSSIHHRGSVSFSGNDHGNFGDVLEALRRLDAVLYPATPPTTPAVESESADRRAGEPS